MPGLLDIAPSQDSVEVRGVKVPVLGVSATGIAMLLRRFEVIRKLFTGKEPDLSADALFQLGPEIIAAIIAAGVGKPGDEEYEAKAASLPAGDQMDLLASIVKVTMPNGPGPFVAKLMAMAGSMDMGDVAAPSVRTVKGAKSGSTPAMKSPPR